MAINIKNSQEQVLDDIPKIILTTSLMETHNPAGDISVGSKKRKKKRSKNMAMNNNTTQIEDQLDDNLEASNKVGHCEIATNDSPKNLLEKVLIVEPLAEHCKMDGGFTENLSEGNANTKIEDEGQSMDPKITSTTSLMDLHNPPRDSSVSRKKKRRRAKKKAINNNGPQIEDQVDDNLKAPNKIGDCEVPNNESQKNLFETVLTPQPLVEHPKMDGGLTENISEVNATTKIEDEVQSMDPKIILNTSLIETPNPAGYNSLRSEKNTGNQVDDSFEASNETGDCEVAHNDSLKNLLETVLTVQPLAEHPKIVGGLTANLPDGNANSKRRKRRKKIKKETEIKDDVQSMDPKIILNTCLMETHNFAGDNSVSNKKNLKDQVDDNLEASKRAEDCEVAYNDSQKNLFETGLTVQSLAEHPKMDGWLPDNLSEGNANKKKRKRKKRMKKKTEIRDEVLSMDLKIILNTSLMEAQNPAGDNSLSSNQNTRDQADDNTEASNRTGYCEVAGNDSQKNLFETGLSAQSLTERPKMDGLLPENLSEGNANCKRRKRRKRIKKKIEIKDEIISVDSKIILNTSLMEMQNPAGHNSLSSKKNTGDLVDNNLEASNKTGDWEVTHNDSQKNLLVTALTIQPLAEAPKIDGGLASDLPEGSAKNKRKRRKSIKRKTENKDEVPSMDPKIILTASLMETQNSAGDNSLSSKKNTGDQVDDNLETSNKTGDCEVAHNDSRKILLETVSTEQPLGEHPKMDEWLTANLSEGNANSRKKRRQKIKNKTEIKDGVESMGKEETVLADVVDVSRASAKLLDERSESLVSPVELEMKMCPCESQYRPLTDQSAGGGNAKFENEANEVNFENIVVEGTTHLCSVDVMEAECLPKNLDQFPNTAPTTASRKKLLVLDVNGLLAHIVMPAPKDCRGDVHILGRAIFKRPFCEDFLKFCFQNFDVGIWSSRTKKIIDRVVDYLLGDLKHKLLFCWDMSHSTQTGFNTLENIHKPLVCKELRKIWENDDPSFPWKKGDYDESNTLLLDDSPYKALLNPLHTAIFPPSYHYTDKEDNSIGPGGDLRVYLEGLLASDNVREYVECHTFGQSAINETNVSWEFYSRVLHTMSNNVGNNHPILLPTLS